MGKIELKVLKFSVSCIHKRERINITPIIYVYVCTSLIHLFCDLTGLSFMLSIYSL
jgi:hypothetical protein